MTNKKWTKSEKIYATILAFLIIYLVIDSFGSIIAIIPIEGSIGSSKSTEIANTLDSVEKNPFVRAVVLKINSPGGTATAVHELYFKLSKLKNAKPIVVSVDNLAASGAYFLAIASNHIVTKQSSEVGSIGVIVELPTKEKQPNIITSGPFKAEPDEQSTYRTLEFIKQDFLNSVKKARGEKLQISLSELSEAKLYNGFDALSLGLIDEIGSLDDAIAKAKSLAGIRVYRAIVVEPSEKVKSPLSVKFGDFGFNTTTAPVYYYLHVQVEK